MTPQTQQLIDAGYVTRKQAAAILGKGDGGNIVALCKKGGVKFIEIKRGTKTTTLFLGVDVVRLFEKMDKKNRPKQAELPVCQGTYTTPPGLSDFASAMESKRMLLIDDREIMDALGRIEAMLTALLGRKDIK